MARTGSRIRLAVLSAALALCGCAGRSIDLQYAPTAAPAPPRPVAVAVVVTDRRPYVRNFRKKPSYLGHFRGRFGNIVNVATSSGAGLAVLMESHLRQDLRALGYKEAAGGPARQLDVTVHDWNFDTVVNARFWYELSVKVLAPDGAVLAQSRIKEQKIIEGTFPLSGRYAMARELPVHYVAIVRSLLRDNPPVLDALGARAR